MLGLSGPQGTGAWRFLWVCLFGALIVGVTLAVLGSDTPVGTRRIFSDLALVTGGLAGAATCAYRRRGFTGRRRRAWGLFAAAGALTGLSNVLVLTGHVVSEPNRWTLYSAPGFLVALSCGMLGLSQFSATARRGTDLARMIFDCVVISGALFLISAALFPKILTSKTPNSIELVLPMVDITVATYALLIFLRVGRSERTVLTFLCAGTALYAATDLTFVVLRTHVQGFGYGSALDAGWLVGYLLIALAALHPAAARQPGCDPPRELSPVIGTLLMYSVLAVAVGLNLYRSSGLTSSLSGVLWLVMTLAIAARQLLLIIDNDKLRQGLEVMVAERTLELGHAIKKSDLLLSSVGEGIYGVDSAGLVTFVNPAGARTLGLAPEALIGTSAHDSFHAAQADGTPFPLERCYVTEAISKGTVTNAEEDSYRRADGRTFPVEVTATPLTSEDRIRGAVVVFRDITQRLEVDRLKSEFVSMVSHELRTPLTSIRGSLGLLAGGALGPMSLGALRMVTLALDSCARLTRLINDILDIERIESGTMPLVLGHHQVAALVESATAQVQILAEQVEVNLVATEVDGAVYADADRVVQTLINLVDNAVKFSPPGSTVEVSSSSYGDFVEFCISDEGRGIPSEKLNSIFSRFEQVDSSDAREKGGSGLGLAISRSVVERLGGRIWAESVEGKGSTFRFTLPRSLAEAAPLAAAGRLRERLSE